MKLADFNLLCKFMTLTMSDNDAEALTALRMANKVLTKDTLTWERVLKRSLRIDEPEFEAAPESYKAPFGGTARTPPRPNTAGATQGTNALEEAFEKINNSNLHTHSGTFKYTIESIEKQWREKGWLSKAQKELIHTTAARINEDGVWERL